MTKEGILNSQKASEAAMMYWYSLPEEYKARINNLGPEPDVIDAYEEGVLYGWNNPNWVSVKEELPKPNIYKEGKTFPLVLVCLNDGCCEDTDAYDTDNKTWCKYGDEVEYWMPLPQPPAQRKED